MTNQAVAKNSNVKTHYVYYRIPTYRIYPHHKSYRLTNWLLLAPLKEYMYIPLQHLANIMVCKIAKQLLL